MAADWIDITRTLSNGIIHWPGDPPFNWLRTRDITGPGTANVSEMSTSVHIGTHIDAPLHFITGGSDIVEVPLSQLMGPAVVVQVTERRDILVEDLAEVELKSGDAVLFRTPNEDLWDQQEFSEDFVALSGDAAMWLVDHGVSAVGIDYLSIDNYHSQEKPAHYALLGNGIIIIEGLDLSGAEAGRYEMIALPLKIAGSDGAPARVLIRPATGKSKKPP
jgi:arylformamidase